ncbi:hypothetical protein Z517_04626 [Fonsecaea pedrosoi CBS 271.37]|uniref:Ankyrin repeat protein n=1 Tax=Fonsecaea pedrosoi CBS 271.37 TaxID=1442368 RepID=A0A0D2GSR6_9EURO|nr:uncharacterized protein Z517_04626 [Fonsecaea pedrosoi CBS 271.37]KIW81600.1 hypothetical protein Z517_04626 [Fonsecaea pedrosoi CBS 271.37]
MALERPRREANPDFTRFNADFGHQEEYYDTLDPSDFISSFKDVHETSSFLLSIDPGQETAEASDSSHESADPEPAEADGAAVSPPGTLEALDDIMRGGTLEELRSWLRAVEGQGYVVDIPRLLRYAVGRANLGMVKYLVEHEKADLRATDILERSVIFFAAACDDLQVLEYIAGKLKRIVSISKELARTDITGATPLYYARDFWHAAANAKYLLQTCAASDDRASLARAALELEVQRGKANDVVYTDWYNVLFLYGWLDLYLRFPVLSESWSRLRDSESFCTNKRLFTLRNLMSQNHWLLEQLEGILLDQYNPESVWIHVPWTNGILVSAVLDSVVDNFRDRTWETLDVAKAALVRVNFKDAFRRRSSPPGNPYLDYLTPVFRQVSGHRSAVVIFPCIEIVSFGDFMRSRKHHMALRAKLKTGFPAITSRVQTTRTLDETHFPSLSAKALEDLNNDQVVSRECHELLSGEPTTEATKPILVVSQLWVWNFDAVVLSAYSDPGKTPDDSLLKDHDIMESEFPVVDAWREKQFGAKTLEGGRNPGVKVACLLHDQIDYFDKTQANGMYQVPLDYFEMGVLRIIASVTEYTKNMDPQSLDVEKERTFMHDLSDIRVELDAIDQVLTQQKNIISDFRGSLDAAEEDVTWHLENDADKRFVKRSLEDDKKRIDTYRTRIAKIQKDADRIDQAISNALNLKRTAASIQDARNSAKDARTSLLLGWAVLGFTIITILFAPLSFMTSLLALPVDSLRQFNGTDATGAPTALYRSGFIAWTFSTYRETMKSDRHVHFADELTVVAEVISIAVTALAVYAAVRYRHVLNGFLVPNDVGEQGQQGGRIQSEVAGGDGAWVDEKRPDAVLREHADNRGEASGANVAAESGRPRGLRKLLGTTKPKSRDPEK